MTGEILTKIIDIYDEKIVNEEQVKYEDLNNIQKDEYYEIWCSFLRKYNKLSTGVYTFKSGNCFEKYSDEKPYMSKKLAQYLKQDGVDVTTIFDDDHAYRRRFTVSADVISAYAVGAKQKVKK